MCWRPVATRQKAGAAGLKWTLAQSPFTGKTLRGNGNVETVAVAWKPNNSSLATRLGNDHLRLGDGADHVRACIGGSGKFHRLAGSRHHQPGGRRHTDDDL